MFIQKNNFNNLIFKNSECSVLAYVMCNVVAAIGDGRTSGEEL